MATEAVKVTLALATGTLVFSAELLKESISMNNATKYLLVFSWIFLGISIVFGVFAYSRIPVMLKENNLDITDKYFEFFGRTHQITFMCGVILLGIAMIIILFAKT